MIRTQKLETEKYLQPIVRREEKAQKRDINRKALRDFNTFLFGCFLIPVALHLPQWIPAIPFFAGFSIDFLIVIFLGRPHKAF